MEIYFKNKKWLKGPKWPILIYVCFLLIEGGHAAPKCDEFVTHEPYNGSFVTFLEVKAPKKSASTGFETIVTFLYPNQIRDADVPKIFLTESKTETLRLITARKEFYYTIIYNSLTAVPEIGRVLIADQVYCENKNDINNAISKEVRTSLKGRKRTSYSQSSGSNRVSYEISSFSDEKCGDTRRVNGFIQGGERKDERRWPWMAAMFVNGKYACTANMISINKAVTAAHCFEKGVSPDQIFLYIYSNRYIQVKSFTKHPKFKKIPDYDIAIIETESIYEKTFVPVCLTGDVQSLQDYTGSILSWSPVEGEEIGDLQGTELKVISNQKCEQNYNLKTPRDSFCVGHGSDSGLLCHGDSGGGFMIKSNKRWFLRGVVSTGITDRTKPNCERDSAVVFTDVTRFLSFVVGNNQGTEGFG